MGRPVSYAMIELSYPLFAVEFDPYNRGFLVVGGGGGESKTGVANKINLLDVSSRAEVTSVAEIDLSRDEDSVQSLASLATKDGLTTFAGINASSKDQASGKNEHFRSFDIRLPSLTNAKKTASTKNEEKNERNGSIQFTGKAAMFKPATGNSGQPYQRLTKLSPVNNRESTSKRIGAIATGMAKDSEILIFDATSSTPTRANLFAGLKPLDGDEAIDMDLIHFDDGAFSIAYCTDYRVSRYAFRFDFDKKTVEHDDGRSNHCYEVPQANAQLRPKCRALRWLGPENLLILQNRPGKGVPELLVVNLSSPGKSGTVIQRKALPSSIEAGLDIDVCLLDADPATRSRQIILAILGKNQSIYILTVEHLPMQKPASKQFSPIKMFTTLKDVHPTPITRIVFSNFFPPRQPEKSNVSVATLPQYVQLASTALGGTVVVESLALTSKPTSPSKTNEVSANRKAPAVRWVLASGGNEFARSWTGIILIIFFLLIPVILFQIYMNATGTDVSLSTLYSKYLALEHPGALPPYLRPGFKGNQLSVAVDASAQADVPSHKHHLRDLLSKFKGKKSRHIIIRPRSGSGSSNGLAASVHEDPKALQAMNAKKFEDLSARDQEKWKKRLAAAGQWSADEGETVLKGVFFSQVAEVVGGAIRDAILH